MQSSYAQQYESLWQHHWWWQSRQQFVLSRIRKLHRQKSLHHILDIGCGNGLFFPQLQTFAPTLGIEPDAHLVSDTGPFRHQIQIRPFDATYLPPQPPDLILMLDVLEHIQDDLAAAKHAHQILAPNGTFLLTVPALPALWSQHDTANLHFRRYTKTSLRQTLTAAGFHIHSLRYFFAWTVPLMLLRRLLSPGNPNSQNTYHVSIPPTPINATMYALSRLEQLSLDNLPLPLGSSLIAIASKN